MISINIFGGLTPLMQLACIVGLLIIVLVIAFSRTAATNLAAFLREIHALYFQHRQRRQDHPSEQEATQDGERSDSNTDKQQEKFILSPDAGANEHGEPGCVEQSSGYKAL